MSELNNLIPPEISNDQLFGIIRDLASQHWVKSILEIGASSGEGSTQAFLEGMSYNDEATLYCLEVSKTRFEKLEENCLGMDQVKLYNMSSIKLDDFPNEQGVTTFYRDVPSMLNNYLLNRVLGWLKQDKDYILEYDIEEDGIEYIKEENLIDNFDIVLIDGSEFTGYMELNKTYGAKVFILDDICSFKNHHSYQQLLKDPSYKLLCENKVLRGGFAVFQKEGEYDNLP